MTVLVEPSLQDVPAHTVGSVSGEASRQFQPPSAACVFPAEAPDAWSKGSALPGFQTQRRHELTKTAMSHATKLGGVVMQQYVTRYVALCLLKINEQKRAWSGTYTRLLTWVTEEGGGGGKEWHHEKLGVA